MSYRAEIDRLLASPPPDWKRQWANARAQLRALDYDAPAHPDASDALQALYLTAGGRESGDRVVGTVPVPAAVRDEAMRAVRMAHRFNYGAWNFIGLARAIQLATVPRIDARSVERMRGFFTRHAKDAEAAGFGNDAKPSRGYLAHLVWGGDPAKEWIMGIEKQMRRNGRARRNPSDLERALAGDKDLKGADLRGARLFRANLTGADLSGANLTGADLLDADLSGAFLADANLTNAYLRDANLLDADLSGANLTKADLSGAKLRRANLSRANLSEANLIEANLIGANLIGANLTGADLSEASLHRANLTGANLTDVDLSEAFYVHTAIVPKPESTRARSLGRMTGPILKAEKPDAPQRAAEFKRRYPAEFERLKGDTQGRDLVPSLRTSLRKKYETAFEWHITVGKYKSDGQRYCPIPNRVLMFNLDLDDPQYTPRQKEFLAKLREVSTRSEHPSERSPYFTVGWVRLCANAEAQTVLIEEVQSDVSVVRNKLKDGSAPEGLQAYADVLADFAPIAERFYADAIGYVFTEAEKQGYTVEMLDYAAKQQFGSPRELYTDLPRSMGMRLGEVSKVVPAVGKAWSYKPNPARVRRNPLAQPSPTLAFSVRKGVVPGVVEVYLYEPADIDDTERSMVAGMMASFNGKRWEASGVAACPGYGPLIYDLTATLLKDRLHATRDRSEASKKFWARQGKKYIEPMTPEDFRAKYGVSVDDIYHRGLVLTPEDLRRMSDHLVSVFFGAKEAEKAGKPLALARCAVPNGRARRNMSDDDMQEVCQSVDYALMQDEDDIGRRFDRYGGRGYHDTSRERASQIKQQGLGAHPGKTFAGGGGIEGHEVLFWLCAWAHPDVAKDVLARGERAGWGWEVSSKLADEISKHLAERYPNLKVVWFYRDEYGGGISKFAGSRCSFDLRQVVNWLSANASDGPYLFGDPDMGWCLAWDGPTIPPDFLEWVESNPQKERQPRKPRSPRRRG